MKKTLKAVFFAVIILTLPVSLVTAQDHKSEQKIKIVVNEGSGEKVIVDTLFNNSTVPDSLILKDGTVVLIKHPGESGLKQHNGKDHFFVTYSSNGNNDGKEYKEVTVISSDSMDINEQHKKGDIDKTFNVYVSDDDKDSKMEKSRYVIAKDGMVVTIEGSDEAKTKELAREIETKLGVNKDEPVKKETVRSETKKTLIK